MRPHPFPSRTRKLSSPVPKILGGKLPGKIGLCQQKLPLSFVLRGIFVFVWMVCIICRSFDPVPAQGATNIFAQIVPGDGFQSPPPRRGRRFSHGFPYSNFHISIPAPAQGATLAMVFRIPIFTFQSPPPRRGRPFRKLVVSISSVHFNPRPRAGGDFLALWQRTILQVSIPAPAQGATWYTEVPGP